MIMNCCLQSWVDLDSPPNSIFMQILTLANHFISTIFRLIKCTKVPKLSRPRSGLRGPQGPSQCLFSGKPSPWSDHPRVSDCRPLDGDIAAISVCFLSISGWASVSWYQHIPVKWKYQNFCFCIVWYYSAKHCGSGEKYPIIIPFFFFFFWNVTKQHPIHFLKKSKSDNRPWIYQRGLMQCC